MFSGASSINLDAKGRFAIPVRYRDLLRVESEGKLVITVDIQSSCLLLYPLNEWHQIEAKLMQLSDTQPTERALKRLLLGHAHECELDNNGRILLPLPLRQYANLKKHTMLVGQLNKFELWDADLWQQLIEESKQKIATEDLASNERLADFSL
ncbi:cell division/cell wall cluster transcriptional repressor MraZ [Shewanella sp. OPT22]|uniref:division/cell wall cluster transcriptional repressor MraZ n=1 Tax=Parashewanella hymeniacidonis TaxID=2807618 RepID=UPI0010217E1F|nr:division/cell wall cluster transcriptional repressor MraZ [Parashewanella hymeniacidonis]RYV03886.1 cell division/cell wall cluster transcriptional repressor MraZ [Shewanella sp. OPT22]